MTRAFAEPRAMPVDEPSLAPAATRDARVRRAVDAHHDAVWRALRRLGVDESAADDAAQRVFCVFVQRVDDVPPAKERTFLLGVAVRVAHEARRARGVRVDLAEDEVLAAVADSAALPDARLDERRARALLDALLDAMPPELRDVFVLHEIEEMTMADIAASLAIPAGTVASRLRRARAHFDELTARVDAREGGTR